MLCHLCKEGAVGQCQTCWKFYCSEHGDGVCEDCKVRGEKSWASMFDDFKWTAAIGESDNAEMSAVLQPSDDASPVALPPAMAPLEMKGRVLRRVVAVGQVKPWGKGELQLTSVEIYNDGAIVHFRSMAPDAPHLHMLSLEDLLGRHIFRVEDDIGTRYDAHSSGGGGDDNAWEGTFKFAPAVPENAGRLRISARLPLSMDLDLQTNDPRALSQRLSLEIVRERESADRTEGPAVHFDIDLS